MNIGAESAGMCTMDKKKGDKNPKFQHHELELLVEEIGKNRNVLFGSFTPTITKTLKTQTWEFICAKINACNEVNRSVKSLKKRWQDLAYMTKKKYNKMRRDRQSTGNIKHVEELSELEQRVIDLVGEVSLHGVDGGLEAGVLDNSELCGPRSDDLCLQLLDTGKTFTQMLTEDYDDDTPSNAYPLEDAFPGPSSVDVTADNLAASPARRETESSDVTPKSKRRKTLDDETETLLSIEKEKVAALKEIAKHLADIKAILSNK